MVKWQVIELGFRTNPNKSLGLVCVWVMTHIRMVLGVIHEKFEERYVMKDDLSRKEITR